MLVILLNRGNEEASWPGAEKQNKWLCSADIDVTAVRELRSVVVAGRDVVP